MRQELSQRGGAKQSTADMPSKWIRAHAERLLDRIGRAFKGVELNGGVTIQETEYHDLQDDVFLGMCGAHGMEDARARDVAAHGTDWRAVDEAVLLRYCGIGGPSFLCADSLRFYAPAYMAAGVRAAPDAGGWMVALAPRRRTVVRVERRAAPSACPRRPEGRAPREVAYRKNEHLYGRPAARRVALDCIPECSHERPLPRPGQTV